MIFFNIVMIAEEKFHLKWNDFHQNIKTSFGELRDDKDFSDVTLACEDTELETHKVILSSCSPFFRRILKRNKNQHPLIFMRGFKADQLKAVVDFIYYGEVNILEQELKTFLIIAEELELKGLAVESEEDKDTKPQPDQLKGYTFDTSDSVDDANVDLEPSSDCKTRMALKSSDKQKINIPEETLAKMESLFRKLKRGEPFTCKVCQFNSKHRGHMREHVETHMEGPRYPCNHCGKTMRSDESYAMRCLSNHPFPRRSSAVLRKHLEKCEV